MFTALFVIIGIIVFFISLVTSGFKTAFMRLLAFTVVGVILDTILFITFAICVYCQS